MTFGLYFMLRQMGEEPAALSESVEKAELVKITKRVEKEIKGSYLKRLYDRFPRVQHGDVEDAFDDAVRKTRKKEYASASSAKKAIRKEMEKSLSEINKRKRATGKSLSCVKSVKAALGDGQSMAELIRRADKILTAICRKLIGHQIPIIFTDIPEWNSTAHCPAFVSGSSCFRRCP